MAVELSLGFWMGLLIGALIVVFVFVPLARNLWDLIPASVDEATYNSFLELDRAIIDIVSVGVDEKEIPFYIKDDEYILVGFNKGCDFNKGDDRCPVSWCHYSDKGYSLPLPKSCSVGKSCLCLFKDIVAGDFKDEDNEPVVPCISYSSIDYLVGKKGEGFNDGGIVNVRGIEHEYLVIYGSCDEAFGARRMKLQKNDVDGSILVIVGV